MKVKDWTEDKVEDRTNRKKESAGGKVTGQTEKQRTGQELKVDDRTGLYRSTRIFSLLYTYENTCILYCISFFLLL